MEAPHPDCYLRRTTTGDGWRTDIALKVSKTFKDEDFPSAEAARAAAVEFRDQVLAPLPKRVPKRKHVFRVSAQGGKYAYWVHQVDGVDSFRASVQLHGEAEAYRRACAYADWFDEQRDTP